MRTNPKTKNSLSIRPSRGKKLGNIGQIKFGESRPAAKMVEFDVELDTKAEKSLQEIGLQMIKGDKTALINYAIVKALENIVS